VLHLLHAGAPEGEALGDDAHERVGEVEVQDLVRLERLAVALAQDDLGLRDRHLVALAPHHLDEDRELQLAAADDLEGSGVAVSSTRMATLPRSSPQAAADVRDVT